MMKVNSEFANVKNQLSVIYQRMQKQDIDAYHAVEDAVTTANIDIRLKSTLDPVTRGLRLSDQLFIFANGMLGQNGLSADILQVTSDLLKCASTSIYNQMEKYVNLVNIGALGLGYYGDIIGDSFNLIPRAQLLDEKKGEILNRTNKFMTNCQVFTVDKINSYITTILSAMQNSDASDVAQALYNYLDDVYNQKKNFVFYVAKQFAGINTVKSGYWGGGLQGNITNGTLTVYWAATPILPEHDVQQLYVDGGNILNTLTTSPVNSIVMSRDANFIYNNIQSSAFSGRSTSLMIVVLYTYDRWASPSSASIGTPPRLNTYYNRFSADWPTKIGSRWYPSITWAIDIIVQ